MADQICIDGVCYATNPNLSQSSSTNSQNIGTVQSQNYAITKRTYGCTTLASLDRDILEAQRKVDSGNLSALGSLNFRKQRKEQFLRGDFDAKLKAQGCPTLGQAVQLDPLPNFQPSAEQNTFTTSNTSVTTSSSGSGCVGGRCGARRPNTSTSSSGGCSPQQIQSGTCGQRRTVTTNAGVGPSYKSQSDGGGSNLLRNLIIVGAIGGGIFFLYKKGKLDGAIAKGKELIGKLKKKK